jgi:hypothetical protein
MADNDNIQTRLDVLPGNLSGIDQFEKETASAFKKAGSEAAKVGKETTSLSQELAKLARKKQLENLAKEFVDVATATGNARQEQIRLQTELAKLDATEADIKSVGASIDKYLTANFKEAAREATKAKVEAEKLDGLNFTERSRRSTFTRDNVGDVSTTFSSLGSLGIGGEASGFLSDLTGVAEYLPNFADAVKNAGLAASQSTGLVGNLSSSLLAAAPGLGAAGAGLASIALVAAPFLVAAGAIAGALALVSGNMEAARQQAEATAKRTAERAAEQAEVSQLIADGNTKEITSRLEVATAQQAVVQAQRDSIIALRDEAQARYDAISVNNIRDKLSARSEIDAFNEQIAGFDEGLASAGVKVDVLTGAILSTGFAAAEAANQLEDSAARQADSFREINRLAASGITGEQLAQQIEATNTARNQELELQAQLRAAGAENTAAYDESIAKQAELNTTLNNLNSATVQNAAAQNDLIAANEAAAESSQALTDTLADFAAESLKAAAAQNLQETRASRNDAIKAARDEITLNQSLAKERASHFDKIEQIEQAGLDKTLELREQLSEGTEKAYDAIADAAADAQAKQKAEDAAFQKESLRAEQDFNREKARLERDAREAEFDAILGNDITALIQSRRKSQEQIGDATEDFGVEKERRSEDFTDERAAAAAETEAKISDMQLELAEFQANTQAKIAATEAATQSQIAAENAAFVAKQTADQAARDQQNQWREEDLRLKEQDRAEDAVLADAERQKALAADLEAIDTEEARKAAANATALAGINALEFAAIRLKGVAESIAGQVTQGVKSGLPTGGIQPIAFANEGTRDRPTPAIIGDVPGGYAESVVKYKKSEGLASSILRRSGAEGGGGTTIVTIPVTIQGMQIGSVVSEAEATRIATTVTAAGQAEIAKAVAQAFSVGQTGG